MLIRLLSCLLLALAGSVRAQNPALKTERFDRDPGWEEHRCRVQLEKIPVVTQDFGYSRTQVASAASGEVGGKVTRTTRPAYYAAKVEGKTLEDRLAASGTFAMTGATGGAGGAGVFFGWFNGRQPGGSGRPIGSLGLDFDFERSGGRLAVRLITGTNQSCGTFITPYLPGKYRTTPLKLDGTRYRWTLDYDPAGAEGRGCFTFTLRSESHPPMVVDAALPAASQQEERARFPSTTTFRVDLPAGFKQQGTRFDRFGLMNMMKAGGTVEIYFGDLEHDGVREDLAAEPPWAGMGNRDSYEDREQVGAHQFGFSPTNHAGGEPGELGGDFWRSGNYAFVGDRVGPLNLAQRLEARGRVKLVVGGPDADMMLGWFSSAHRDRSPLEAGDFVGVAVGGPTRVGHMFAPSLTTARGRRAKVDHAPVLKPGESYAWSLVYDPAGNSGAGEMTVTLGEETVMLPLQPGLREDGAQLDRFGMFTSQAGGQMVRIYLDDLTYSAGP